MDPKDLDLKKLRAFQFAARHGSLSWAANHLRLTIPAVSFQIRRLEEDLGITLFHRLPNRLVLTNAGERLMQDADAIFEQVEQVLGNLSEGSAPSGRLSISTTSDLAWYFSPKLSNYVRRYPNVEISLHIYKSSETLALVSRGELDIGIGYFPRIPRGLMKEPLTESTLSLACAPSHPFLRNRPPRLSDIARHRLLSLPLQSSTRKLIDRVFAERGIETRGVIEAGNCQTALEFATRGIGIAIVHSLCARNDHRLQLSYIDLDQQFGRVEFSMLYRKGTQENPVLLGLIEELTSRDAPAVQAS